MFKRTPIQSKGEVMFTDKAVFDDMYKKGTQPMNKQELIEALRKICADESIYSNKDGFLSGLHDKSRAMKIASKTYALSAQTISRQAERIAELKLAMDDLLGSPMGVVPKSAEKFYDSKSGRFAARKSLGENNE